MFGKLTLKLAFKKIQAFETRKFPKPYIYTVSGAKVIFGRFPHGAVPLSCIRLGDIAHSLSRIPRFNGHLPVNHSVAQHCMMVAEHLPGSPEEKLGALLHDAAEAYLCDIPAPIKPLLGRKYRNLHNRTQAAIYRRFGVRDLHPLMKLYDQAACVFEGEAFFDKLPQDLGYSSNLRELWTPWTPTSYAAMQGNVDPVFVADRYTMLANDYIREMGLDPLIIAGLTTPR